MSRFGKKQPYITQGMTDPLHKRVALTQESMLPTELLVHILSECTYESVLECSRANHQFREIVETYKSTFAGRILKRDFRVHAERDLCRQLRIRRAMRDGKFDCLTAIEDEPPAATAKPTGRIRMASSRI